MKRYKALSKEIIFPTDMMAPIINKGKQEWKVVGNLMKETFPGIKMRASNFHYYIFRRPQKSRKPRNGKGK